jgi:hypothetical protein
VLPEAKNLFTCGCCAGKFSTFSIFTNALLRVLYIAMMKTNKRVMMQCAVQSDQVNIELACIEKSGKNELLLWYRRTNALH